MSETQRASGIGFEYKARDALTDDGYFVVRAAGSRGAVDLVALKPGQTLLVSCKRTGTCPPVEWDRLVGLAGELAAVPVLAVNGLRGRGVAYWELLGPKLRGRAMTAQPARPFLTDELDLPSAEDVRGILRPEWVQSP